MKKVKECRCCGEKNSEKVSPLIRSEEKKGLLRKQTYTEFAEQIAKNKTEMKKLLENLRGKGYKVVGYGASAKGNTMLNYFRINVGYIVDDNELKWGYRTPGRNIPIRRPDDLQNDKQKLAIVILSWNFYDEIKKKIKKIRGKNRKDLAILYVPAVSKERI